MNGQTSATVATLTTEGDTLALSGEVDFSNAVRLCRQGERWISEQAPRHCRLQLDNLTRCNSAATTLLLCWLRAANRHQKTVQIENIPPTLTSLLDLGGLSDIVVANAAPAD